MHEYSLHGQVALSRHTQLLHVLAGVSAMPPVPVLERHILYKPTVIPTRQAAQVGGSQAIQDASKQAARQAQAASTDVYYMKLVENLGGQRTESENKSVVHADHETDEEEGDDNTMKVEDLSDSLGNGGSKSMKVTKATSVSTWQMVFHDVPEPGARPVTARVTTTTKIEEGDAMSFMEGLGYTFIAQYLQHGHSFTYQDIGIHLTRILMLPEELASKPRLKKEDIPTEDMCRLLDASGAYTLQAAVSVADTSRPEVVSRATSELLHFRSIMRGIVDMRVVERLSLDTRVKS